MLSQQFQKGHGGIQLESLYKQRQILESPGINFNLKCKDVLLS